MKRAFSTILLAMACIAASAQVNRLVDSLFATLERMGIDISRSQQSKDNGTIIIYEATAIDRHAIDTVCATLAQISHHASYCEHYESHSNGMDTVMYSICLSTPGNVHQHQPDHSHAVPFALNGSDSEFIMLDYNYCESTQQSTKAQLTYTHKIEKGAIGKVGNFKPEQLKATIASLMSRNSDEHSYHTLLLDVTDACWIPIEMATLESNVDGKKEYVK